MKQKPDEISGFDDLLNATWQKPVQLYEAFGVYTMFSTTLRALNSRCCFDYHVVNIEYAINVTIEITILRVAFRWPFNFSILTYQFCMTDGSTRAGPPGVALRMSITPACAVSRSWTACS